MMAKKTLHITNGSDLTNDLTELQYEGHFLTWQEMLCEGPTAEEIDSDQFIALRKEFLSEFYDVEILEDKYKEELDILNHPQQFEAIVLWFDYDLYCHVNLIAIISLLKQKKIKQPLYLVCSGRIKGEKEFKGLAELKPEQLHKHYDNKIRLSNEDIDLMSSLWRVYCGRDHNLFKPFIVQRSSFPYLSNCLKAHLQRFPDSVTGLSTLEYHTLQMINTHNIKSKRHLLGYILNFQGYYGYNSMQINQMIDSLAGFFTMYNNRLMLNENGFQAIKEEKNVSTDIKPVMYYGGAKKTDFQFDKEKNKLIKTN